MAIDKDGINVIYTNSAGVEYKGVATHKKPADCLYWVEFPDNKKMNDWYGVEELTFIE